MSDAIERLGKTLSTMKGSVENIKVVVRCRPLSKKEIENGNKSVVQVVPESGQVNVLLPPQRDSSTAAVKQFTFDFVFPPLAPQVDVYTRAARPIVDNVLEGYNGTIFAYGQTGTGKTYTMEGQRSLPELRGITPNTFSHIFSYIAKAEDNKKFLVRASYLEIYNEEVRDLLGKPLATLEIKERPDIGVYVKDLSTFMVHKPEDLDRIMSVGNKNRVMGATHMNAHSSRSHVIFTITIECSEPGLDGRDHVRVGKMNLVDLAGSERQVKTRATGQRLKEATKINLSLSTLGNVISALVDGRSSHVPYRNSKLTRLLQDSLGGNAKTLMCANIGPADYNLEETLSTLRFASRAKNIQNKARINEDPKDAVLRQLQHEIEELRKKLEEGEEEGESSSAEEEGGIIGEIENGPSKKKRPKKKTLSEEQLRSIKAQIEADRHSLLEQKGLAEEEKNRLTEELRLREEELTSAQHEHKILAEKLHALEKKIIVGGENLLQKAELQERLLEESAKELEETKRAEQEIQLRLRQTEAERVNFEEKYSGLREEISGKTKKMRKVVHMLASARAELADNQAEHQRELEEMLETVRQLSRELGLAHHIIDSAVPSEYQELIEKNIFWNEEIGDWQLKCVAYAGNNMHPEEPIHHQLVYKDRRKQKAQLDLSHVYFAYSQEGAELALRHKSAGTSRARSAKSARRKRRGPLNGLDSLG